MKKYFTDFQSTPLPDVKEDIHQWGGEMVAALKENLYLIQGSIAGTGRDLVESMVSVTGNHTVLNSASKVTIVCNNTSPITVTLYPLVVNHRISVIRAGTGAVTIDGYSADLVAGELTQPLPSQYDAADLVGTNIEWVLS